MPKKSKYNQSIVKEEDEDDHMEIDVEPDINNNYHDFFTSSESESDESENEDFFPEEEMVTIDIWPKTPSNKIFSKAKNTKTKIRSEF
ncbi:hypothetical protein BpHYR1_002088 [Brachionus plicatilis]|uniref:Uncharacterized protein n=1 Tax=Brachionus plicatilis TaxID=10195 RepID=A0A3M7Q2J2_BRAPC|nr:hypothetical protein BpHYR1_002088 [Brachionus plicatilis]